MGPNQADRRRTSQSRWRAKSGHFDQTGYCTTRREQAHLSQEELAERLGVHETTVRRWEAGVRPQPAYLRKLSEVLGATPEEMGLALRSSVLAARDMDLADPLSRRRFLQGVAGIAGTATAGTLFDDERLAYALNRPDYVDLRTLDDLVSLLQLYVSQAQIISPLVLLPPVHDLTHRIRWLLAGSHPDGIRRRLQVLYAEGAITAGRLSFWSDDRGVASETFRIAEELAREVDERHLAALVLAFRADLVSSVPYLGTIPASTTLALDLFDQAASLDEGSAWPPLLRSWIYACRAEEYATLQQASQSDRDMDTAHRALDVATHRYGTGDTVIDIAVLDIAAAAAGLSGFEGACAIALGRAREARESFEAGLKEQSSVGRLSGLAAAYALEGDVESAADLLVTGMEEAVRRQLPTRLRRIQGVRARYLTHAQDHPAVQRFDQALRQAVA